MAPVCTQYYNLAVLRPKIAKEWHPDKNGPLTPRWVTPGSHKKVWWLGGCGHEWQAPICRRGSRMVPGRRKPSGCPYCAVRNKKASKEYNLAVGYPNLIAEWHPTKNGKLKPQQLVPDSHHPVWWRCAKGHEWRASPCNRTRQPTCPYCTGYRPSKDYNLALINPSLAKEWHPTKNGTLAPRDVAPGTKALVWWRCAKGHEWRAQITARNRGQGCPKCYDVWRRGRMAEAMVRLPRDLKVLLRNMAHKENRSFSSQVNIALAEWLRDRGKLAPQLKADIEKALSSARPPRFKPKKPSLLARRATNNTDFLF